MSQYRVLKKQTATLLRGLGETPDHVAETLQASGVRGVPKSNRSCAIALYLTALMASDRRVRSVMVGRCSLRIALAHEPDNRPAGHLTVQLPKPVRRFVTAFDARIYPAILREPPLSPLPSATAPVSASTPTCR